MVINLILSSHAEPGVNLILRSRAEHGVSKDGASRCPASILRDARDRALLRMRLLISRPYNGLRPVV
jgi:hypothetical protein